MSGNAFAQLLKYWRAPSLVVIGSGAGGLTSAVLLAKHAGKRVLVLERHYTAGGFTHVLVNPPYAQHLAHEFPALLARPSGEDEALRGMLRAHGQLLFARNGAALYAVQRNGILRGQIKLFSPDGAREGKTTTKFIRKPHLLDDLFLIDLELPITAVLLPLSLVGGGIALLRTGRWSVFDGGDVQDRLAEVYPFSAFAVLLGRIPPRKSTPEGRAARIAALRARLHGSANLDGRSHHELDAAAAAVTALALRAGQATWVGNPREALMVLPGPLRDYYEPADK